jgi:hypothetical protein
MIKFMRMASPYFNLYCPVVMAMIMLLMAGIAQIRADTSYSDPISRAPRGVTGLTVRIYSLPVRAKSRHRSLADIMKLIERATVRQPVFHSRLQGSHFNFGPASANTSAPAFLGMHTSKNSPALDHVLVAIHGYIDIPNTGTYTFHLAAANGPAVVFFAGAGSWDTGTMILARNDHGLNHAPSLPNPVHCDFFPIRRHVQTGMYPITLFYFGPRQGKAKLEFSVHGPGNTVFFIHAFHRSHRLSLINPFHRYHFQPHTGRVVEDTAPADRFNARLVGHARITDKGLVTGETWNSAASISHSGMGAFTSSFSMEDWFTRLGAVEHGQTLFAFSDGTLRNSLIGMINGGGSKIAVTFNRNGQSYQLSGPGPRLGALTMLAVSYNAATRNARLYINGRLRNSVVIPHRFHLAHISRQNGVGGLSPVHAGSLHGITREFRLYRAPLRALHIQKDFRDGPDNLINPR